MALTKKAKIATTISIVLTALVAILIIFYFLIGGFFFSLALDPGSNMLMDSDTGDQIMKPPAKLDRHFSDHNDWFDESGFTIVNMTSSDKRSYKLSAYQLLQPTPTDKWAVTIHGYRSNAMMMRYYAYYFYSMGFNVLMPDLRGHGLSDGDYIGMGWHDSTDILDWVNNTIINSNKNAEVAIFGVSMGAATTMMATGLTLPSNIKVAVADCGYSNVYEQFAYVLKNMMKYPKEPIMSAANVVTNINAGYDLKKADSLTRLRNSKTPTLFFHGNKDDFVPYYMMNDVYNACAASDKKQVTIEGAEHAQSTLVNHELYWSELQAFVGKYINVKNII